MVVFVLPVHGMSLGYLARLSRLWPLQLHLAARACIDTTAVAARDLPSSPKVTPQLNSIATLPAILLLLRMRIT